MAINLDLVIETEEESVDMKAGLMSMQGISDAVRCISESVLTGEVPERQSSKSSVRTSLKKSFKGSYGHIFTLDVYDSKVQKKLNKIGKVTLVELISFFINEALYRESAILSLKAQGVIDELGERADKIVDQLRVSSLKNAHEISRKFNHNVKLRFRKSGAEQLVMAQFDKFSDKIFEVVHSKERVDLKVGVTRLNIHTGNGRLQPEGKYETVAFGFGTEYKEVAIRAKKVFSENLNHNNGLERAEWKYLRIEASPVKLRDGKIVKYIVKAFYED